MANTGFKGIDCRQTGNELVFEALLQSSAGALVTTGTTNLYLWELQSDGTIKTYDFASTGSTPNQFTTATVTTENLGMTYRKSNNGATDTGFWTAVLSTLTGFTIGARYFFRVNNSGASPTDQVREFQYGGAEGDLLVTAGSTGQATMGADAQKMSGTALTARDIGASVLISSGTGAGQLDVTSGLVNVGKINGVATSSVTTINANIGTTGVVGFTVAGYVDCNPYYWTGGLIPATSFAGIPKVDVADYAGHAVAASSNGIPNVNIVAIANQTASASAPVTFPSGTLANTGNIAGGTITTVTNLTNLPSIPANWLTAAGIAASALNGKGDWALSTADFNATQKTSLNAATPASVQNTAGTIGLIPNDGTGNLSLQSIVAFNANDNAVTFYSSNGSGLIVQSTTGDGAQFKGAGGGHDINLTGDGILEGTVSGNATLANQTTQGTGTLATSAQAGTILTQTGATAIAAAVLNPAKTSYNQSGSIGEAINDAGSAADPLTNAPSKYTEGQIGWNMAQIPLALQVSISPAIITIQNNTATATPIEMFYGSAKSQVFILQDANGNPITPPNGATFELVVFTPGNNNGLPDVDLFKRSGTFSGSTVTIPVANTDPSAVGSFTYGLWDSTNNKCYGSNTCQIINAGVP
jgi:hypothetical protein